MIRVAGYSAFLLNSAVRCRMKSLAVPFNMNAEPLTGRVFNIQRFSLHDGPGIRSVVFLKGCQMSCIWCANPEGLRQDNDVLWRASSCQHCGACVDACQKVFISGVIRITLLIPVCRVMAAVFVKKLARPVRLRLSDVRCQLMMYIKRS